MKGSRRPRADAAQICAEFIYGPPTLALLTVFLHVLGYIGELTFHSLTLIGFQKGK